MKDTQQRITPLASDIKNVFQKQYGEKLEMLRLCRDHKDHLLHTDKKPVLAISQDNFVGIFDIKAHHYFLTPDQVFRFGTYCKLASHNIIAIMLKAIWESFLSDMVGFPFDSDLELNIIINDEDLIENYMGDFKPHNSKMFKLFKEDTTDTVKQLTYDTFEFIIQDLVDGKHFLFENQTLDQLYPEEDLSEIRLLAKISEEQRENYGKAKELWLLKSTDLDDMLLLLERKKKLNLALENKYFETFGKQESDRSDALYQLEKYTLVLKISKEQPGLSIREILRKAQEEMRYAEHERSLIRNKIARSQNKLELFVPQGGGSTATAEFKESYMQSCIELLRKLYFMLHTDHCPGYQELSPQKQTEIDDLWLQVMKHKNDELYSYSPTNMLYSMPDYEQLELIYRKACQILELDPEEFTIGNRLEFMIRKGSSIESILEFLSAETEKLSLHLAHLELVQNEYTNEDQCQAYRNALSDPIAHETTLDHEISNMKEQISDLKKKISATVPKIEM